MAPDTKHLEVTLETQVESVNVAEEMCLRVAEAAGFGEDDCYRIGMSVREGVINAFHYGNKERPEKKIHLARHFPDARLHGRIRRGARPDRRRGNHHVKEAAFGQSRGERAERSELGAATGSVGKRWSCELPIGTPA
jgi:anti-sigma regulatory factor (Ser/Thr protein kinase)